MQRLLSLTILAVMATAVACDGASDATSPSAEVLRDVARVREVTIPFHDIETATQAGWGDRLTDCFSSPGQGGMGYHYGNLALFDDEVEVSKPELLLYEPQQNGELELVAVEYAIPFTEWTSSQPPRLFGREFHRNLDFELWILHAWVHRDNPSGMFEDWNPKVSCEHAPTS
jgi:hypothetical protein